MYHACAARLDVTENLKKCLFFGWTKALFSSHPKPKSFQYSSSHWILRHMHEALNIDEKKLITQFACKSQDESFDPS